MRCSCARTFDGESTSLQVGDGTLQLALADSLLAEDAGDRRGTRLRIGFDGLVELLKNFAGSEGG